MSLSLSLLLLAAPQMTSGYNHPSHLQLALLQAPVLRLDSEPLDNERFVVYLEPGEWGHADLAVEPDDGPAYATLDGATLNAPAEATESDACPLHATLRSLGRWLLVLLSMVFVVALLGSVSSSRRPLPLLAMAVRHPMRPIPIAERLLVLACLWSPMLMLLSLMQAEREMLSSVLLCMATTGILCAASMLAARRRLAAQLRWAFPGPLREQAAGAVVRAEVDARRMAPPHGAAGPVPWFAADLVVATRGEASPEIVRVALDGAIVDEGAARALVRMAMGLPAQVPLTVLGPIAHLPADADSVGPHDRVPTQARVGLGRGARALVVAGTPAQLARRLRGEALLLSGALCASVAAALLVLL
jgi:hypothetical protein